MAKVTLKHKNESFESLMRRFKRAVDNDDLLNTLRKYEFYERPGDKRKRAMAAAIKRQQRLTQEDNWIRLGIQPHQVAKKDKKTKKRENDDIVSGLY